MEEDKALNCEKCQKVFKNKQSLKNHNEISHEKKLVKCIICDYQCTRKENLKDHIAYIHEKKPYKNQCKHCGKRYYQRHDLTIHIQVVHE